MKEAQVALVDTQSLESLQIQRTKLKQFVETQLIEDIDWGTVPGTRKPGLYKPGAEKLAKLFNLGARIIDKDRELNFEKKHAYYAYTIEMYHLASDKVVSQCEGSANSLEKKYIGRPIGDLLNTLQKMAQKRAYVGAVIQAVGASDFYTHDTEDTHVPHAQREIEDRTHYQTEPGSRRIPLQDGQELPYRIPFGQYKSRSLEEIDVGELKKYCEKVIERGKKEGLSRDAMSETIQDFLRRAELYLHEVG